MRAIGVLLGMALMAQASAAPVNITGAGATFPYPVYARWAADYEKAAGDRINYQSIGSGGGIKQVKARTVVFGASDDPLDAAELGQSNLVQWPMIIGGVVPVANLPQLKDAKLKLTGEVLARIFLGEIKRWDDAALKELNPGLALPGQDIAVVHRSDGSGTTFNFTYYLASQSPAWKDHVGVGKAVKWPVGVGAKGNEGVSSMVGRIPGAIAYVEYAYALESKPEISLRNRSGAYVAPSQEGFQAAAANADWGAAPGYRVILSDQPGAESWPMTAASFILMPAHPQDPAAARAALKFFDWCFREGAALATELHYVAMPDKVITMIRDTWHESLRDPDGKPLWPIAGE
jgi:phosphate transport system substrate-binding protein